MTVFVAPRLEPDSLMTGVTDKAPAEVPDAHAHSAATSLKVNPPSVSLTSPAESIVQNREGLLLIEDIVEPIVPVLVIDQSTQAKTTLDAKTLDKKATADGSPEFSLLVV